MSFSRKLNIFNRFDSFKALLCPTYPILFSQFYQTLLCHHNLKRLLKLAKEVFPDPLLPLIKTRLPGFRINDSLININL